MDKKAKTDDAEYKPPKYFSFITNIIPQLLKFDDEQLGAFIRHVLLYVQIGKEEQPYEELSGKWILFDQMKTEIDKSIWMSKRKSIGGKNAQAKLRGNKEK